MPFFSPRVAPGIGVAMARVAEKFYFFTILLVVATIYLQHAVGIDPFRLLVLAVLTAGVIIFFHFYPWDRHEPRVFTFSYLFSSCLLLALLVHHTGGLLSSYGVLFFLVIIFSYFYNLMEMFAIATVVTLFYLLPYLYSRPQQCPLGSSSVMVLFFYLGTYVLYGVTRFVLKKNRALEDLNTKLSELYSITAGLTKDMEKEALLESLSERLKDHLPSTYCILMLLDEKENLTTRLSCPVRTFTWEPVIGAAYGPRQLAHIRQVFATRQPRVFRLESDEIDEEMRKIITKDTKSFLAVPIRIAAENAGVLIFGEERTWSRAPFQNEKILFAVAISKQIAIGLNMWWCLERIKTAQHDLRVSHDKVIKAERLAAVGEVTRAVEHEINNPLNVIANWAEVYREDTSIDQNLRSKFQIIFDMAMRIRDAVRKLTEIKDAKATEFLKGQKMTDIE